MASSLVADLGKLLFKGIFHGYKVIFFGQISSRLIWFLATSLGWNWVFWSSRRRGSQYFLTFCIWMFFVRWLPAKSLLGIYSFFQEGLQQDITMPAMDNQNPQWPLLQPYSMSLFICNWSHVRYIIKKFNKNFLSGFFLPHCQWHFSKLSINFEAIKNNFPELLLLCNEPWQMHCFDICDLRCPNHQTLGSSKAIVQI